MIFVVQAARLDEYCDRRAACPHERGLYFFGNLMTKACAR
jgi:hypothetical protein